MYRQETHKEREAIQLENALSMQCAVDVVVQMEKMTMISA